LFQHVSVYINHHQGARSVYNFWYSSNRTATCRYCERVGTTIICVH